MVWGSFLASMDSRLAYTCREGNTALLQEVDMYSVTTMVDCCLYTNPSMDRLTNSVERETAGAPSESIWWKVRIVGNNCSNGCRRAIQRLEFGKNSNGLSCFILSIAYIPVITYCKVESSGMGKFLAPGRVGEPIPAEAVKRLGSSKREENPPTRW